MSQTITQDQILAYLPHRYENLLLDQVVSHADDTCVKGEFSLTVGPDDALGRHLFFRHHTEEEQVLIGATSVEILALGSLVCTGKLTETQLAIFTGISQFQKHQHLPLSQLISGQSEKVAQKAGFLSYRGALYRQVDTHPAVTAQVKAFVTDTSASQSEQESPKMGTAPPSGSATPIQFKRPSKKAPMIVADGLIESSDTEAWVSYTYPSNHPLIKGHFPGNPVMMGIMQWMAIEDAVLAHCQMKQGAFSVSTNAEIVKSDGELVAEVKGAQLQGYINDDTYFDSAEIVALKRIVFRRMIVPGEEIFIHLTNCQIHS
ncbi:MAG: hypothetical protein CL521_03305 [Actinobacteria bacterium]|nr:hypothetical protein [Actinomycetota bacterium]